MDFKDVFVDSLRYPFSDIKKLFIVFLLTLGNILIIPIIFAGGYLIRIIETTLEGSDTLPEFSNIKKLFIDGIKFGIVNFIYGIPVLLLNYYMSLQLSLNTQAIVPFIITSLASFAISIILLMALINMAHEKKFGAAFDLGQIINIIKEIGWKKYISYLVIYTIIISFIALIVQFLAVFVTSSSPESNLRLLQPTSIAGLSYLIFAGAVDSYLLVFQGRFLGLIYPKRIDANLNENPEIEDEN